MLPISDASRAYTHYLNERADTGPAEKELTKDDFDPRTGAERRLIGTDNSNTVDLKELGVSATQDDLIWLLPSTSDLRVVALTGKARIIQTPYFHLGGGVIGNLELGVARDSVDIHIDVATVAGTFSSGSPYITYEARITFSAGGVELALLKVDAVAQLKFLDRASAAAFGSLVVVALEGRVTGLDGWVKRLGADGDVQFLGEELQRAQQLLAEHPHDTISFEHGYLSAKDRARYDVLRMAGRGTVESAQPPALDPAPQKPPFPADEFKDTDPTLTQWPPPAPSGSKPKWNAPGGARYRYDRYRYDKWEEAGRPDKEPSGIKKPRQYFDQHVAPKAVGQSPGEGGSPEHKKLVDAVRDANDVGTGTVGSRRPDAVGKYDTPFKVGDQTFIPEKGGRVLYEAENFYKDGSQMVSEGREQVRQLRKDNPRATIVVQDVANPKNIVVYPPGTQPPAPGRLSKVTSNTVPYTPTAP